MDAHVGKHLFEECLQKYLKGKTRLLATHQLQYIKAADSIIFLDQGKVRVYDDYRVLLEQHPEYGTLIAKDEEEEEITMKDRDEFKNTSSIQRQISRASVRVGFFSFFFFLIICKLSNFFFFLLHKEFKVRCE